MAKIVVTIGERIDIFDGLARRPLAWHRLIPAAVYQVSSVTIGRSRTFTTPVGVFSFQRVPARMPRAGVKAIQVSRDTWAFIATPLRAITDVAAMIDLLTLNIPAFLAKRFQNKRYCPRLAGNNSCQ